MLAKFKAEDSTSAVRYRNQSLKKPGETPPQTKLTYLQYFWGKHFPKREIDFSTYSPTARSEVDGSLETYQVSQMSDGERVGLYLAARILDSSSQLIVIDEPELHLHPVLAKNIWNSLEDLRPDSQFIYITHDLPFALSRRNAEFLILNSNGKPKLVDKESEISDEIIQELLGAASFSINASKIVFCEGHNSRSIDEAFFDAWFADVNTAVISVGSCQQVEKSVEVFSQAKFVKGMDTIGIIDRDYWPENYFKSLDDKIILLDLHEIESLFCLSEVFKAIGSHLQVDELDKKYESFIHKARSSFTGVVFNKHLLERIKKRIEYKLLSKLNSVSPRENLNQTRDNLLEKLHLENWEKGLDKIFEEEHDLLKSALNNSTNDFLKYFPGKSILGYASSELGITKEMYINLVVKGLRGENKSLNELQNNLVVALEAYLPKRN